MTDWTHKFYFFKKKDTFLSVIDTVPEGLDPIIFIEDSSEVWVNGHYFQVGYPGIQITQNESNVNVVIGQDSFQIQATGEGLSVQKGTGNTILFNSSALSTINTDDKLTLDPGQKKLSHVITGAHGDYGTSTDEDNQSIISVPYISVDTTGHIVSAKTVNITIRDYVKQCTPDDADKDRNILIAENDNQNEESGPVVKAGGLQYNNNEQKLKGQNAGFGGNVDVSGDVNVIGIIKGNVEGNVTGVATPNNHADPTTKYGAGTSAGPGGTPAAMYGHVKLQDDFDKNTDGTMVVPDAGNTDKGKGVAASPLMVYNGMKDAEVYADGINPKIAFTDDDGKEKQLSGDDRLVFSDDFEKDGDSLYLKWEIIK